MTMTRLSLRAALVVLFGSSLLACKAVGVKDAYAALDAQGGRKRSVFHTDTSAIYCIMEMASGVNDVTVLARLRAHALYSELDGGRTALGTIVGSKEQAPRAAEHIVVSYRLEKPMGFAFYPAGDFSCEFLIDGELEATVDFEIRYPSCPLQPIETGTSCAGLVVRESECPGPIGDSCLCTADEGIWECQ
jgi:hypothetical protein